MSIPLVFFWPGSPWASKVTSYLALRGIPYAAVHQPITMPRPDLESLGISYRRIPLVAIGRNVYCDTLLILEALESVYQAPQYPSLSPTNPEGAALTHLLEKWTDLAVFPHAANCIPIEHSLVTDPKFIKDRSDLWGYDWDPENRRQLRPASIAAMRGFFEFLEHSLLSDGREWVLHSERPVLADLQAAWIFDWMMSLDDAFPGNVISEAIYPKSYAWCARYRVAVENHTKQVTVEEIDGVEALRRIEDGTQDMHLKVDSNDPLGLAEGQAVKVAPVDTGFSGVQEGNLVGLDARQAVVETKTKNGEKIRVWFPRWNFKISATAE